MNSTSEPAPGATDHAYAPSDRGLSDLIENARCLAAEARTLAEAEITYQKARAQFAAGAAAGIALRGLIAAAFALFALASLVIGLLLSLATIIGPWWATLAVAGSLFVLAGIFALSAKSRWSRALPLIMPEEAGDA